MILRDESREEVLPCIYKYNTLKRYKLFVFVTYKHDHLTA